MFDKMTALLKLQLAAVLLFLLRSMQLWSLNIQYQFRKSKVKLCSKVCAAMWVLAPDVKVLSWLSLSFTTAATFPCWQFFCAWITERKHHQGECVTGDVCLVIKCSWRSCDWNWTLCASESAEGKQLYLLKYKDEMTTFLNRNTGMIINAKTFLTTGTFFKCFRSILNCFQKTFRASRYF